MTALQHPKTAAQAAAQAKSDRWTCLIITAAFTFVSGSIMAALLIGNNQAIASQQAAPTQTLLQEQIQQWIADKVF